MIRMLALVSTLFAAAPQDDGEWQPPSYAKELAPLAPLVGTVEGDGQSLMGPYRETQTGEWGLNKTVLIVRTKSTAGGMTVFEDVRVFSWDNEKKKIRCRQFGMGDLAVYDVDVRDGGKTIVLNETAHEGRVRSEWRYTFTFKNDREFSYVVDAKDGGKFSKYVSGTLARK